VLDPKGEERERRGRGEGEGEERKMFKPPPKHIFSMSLCMNELYMSLQNLRLLSLSVESLTYLSRWSSVLRILSLSVEPPVGSLLS